MNAKVDISGVCLETERLILRPWTLDDLYDFNEYASVSGVGEMAGWSAHKSLEESKVILEMFIAGKKTFAVVLKDSGKVIGSVGLEDGDRQDAGAIAEGRYGREIGYVLSKDYWGHGFMPEAVKRVIRYAFDECKMDFLLCGHFAENHQSKRVVEKCGFIYLLDNTYVTGYGVVKENKLYYLLNDKG